jgi:hypothetical protein
MCPGEPLFIPRLDLEERIFGAIRDQVLTPDHVAYAVERALGLVERKLGRAEPPLSVSARARLAEIEGDLAALRRVGERTGRSVAGLVAELEAERAAAPGGAGQEPAGRRHRAAAPP